MTINQAITLLDDLTPNTYSPDCKIAWLNRLDQQVQRELVQTHQDPTPLAPYTAQTPPDTALLIPTPYDACYLRYMQAQLHYENGEISRYQNAMALFNATYSAWCDYFNRTHMPLDPGNFR